jgi:hypothetical protein
MDDESRPPWREPMLWLVVALPAASIVAGITLLVLAARGGSVDSVADPVRRTAQVQDLDLGPDERARDLRLSAIVRSQGGVVEVLPVSGPFDRAASLQLALRHPARAALDRSLLLAPHAQGWRAKAALDTGHDWNVQLQARDGRWRLQGRLPAGQHAAYLAPVLGRDR